MTRRTIEIGAFCVTLLLSAMALHAWLTSHDERTRLASTLAAQKQLIEAADAREHSRQAALDATLEQIENLKRTTQTPEQILRGLTQYLQLPEPITLSPSTSAAPSHPRKFQKGTESSAEPSVPDRQPGAPNSPPQI